MTHIFEDKLNRTLTAAREVIPIFMKLVFVDITGKKHFLFTECPNEVNYMQKTKPRN